MKLLSTGAEASVYAAGNRVYKHRKVKAYRHPELDRKLRRERMHRETNILEKVRKLGIPAPQLIERDEEQATLGMQLLEGPLLRDALDRKWKRYAPQIGKRIAQLHAADIIHGDLPTSNMIAVNMKDIALIDFGLSFISQKVEDRAVDLHLLRQALESKHHKIAGKCYPAILATYRRAYPKAKEVLARLELVEQRGRYKGKGDKL